MSKHVEEMLRDDKKALQQENEKLREMLDALINKGWIVRRQTLSKREEDNGVSWGYPHVYPNGHRGSKDIRVALVDGLPEWTEECRKAYQGGTDE